MANTRKIVAEFFGVFLIGVLVGVLLCYCFTDTQLVTVMSRWNNPATLESRINTKYARDYQLSPDEIEKIKPMTHQLAQDLFKVRHQFGVDVIATLNRDHAAIAAQLTPEHRALYEEKVAKHTRQLNDLLLGDQSSPTPGDK